MNFGGVKLKTKITSKSIKKWMPSNSQLKCIFDGFLDGKWRHADTKIGSTIDANFENAIFKRLMKNK